MSKISELPVATTVTLTDIVPVVTDPGTTPATKRATLQTIKDTLGASSGKIIQRRYAEVVGPVSTTSNTSGGPTWNTGMLLASLSITPTSASNRILVRASVPLIYHQTSTSFIWASIFKNASGSMGHYRASGANISGTNFATCLSLEFTEVAGTTSPITWALRAVSNIPGTLTFAFGTDSYATLVVEEYDPT